MRADNPEFKQGNGEPPFVMRPVEGEVVHVESVNNAADLVVWIADADGVVHRCNLGTVHLLPPAKKK